MSPDSAEPADGAALLPVGASVGPFRVARVVARRPGATVYLAANAASRVWAALKLRHADAGLDDETRRTLDAAQRLSHPHIARVLGHGLLGPYRWLATEWVPGRDLAHYTHSRWLLPETRAVHAAWQLAQALGHAHRHGVVHRDIKPANVRLHLPRDLLKLTDFGAARIDQGEPTRSGVFVGTPAYMAPEQLQGATPTAQADLYALGVVLHELLTGERPHAGEHLGELLRQITRGERTRLADRRPDLPAPLSALVDELLAPDPRQRPAQAGDVARRLRTLLGTWPAPAAPRQDARQGEAAHP